MSVGEADRAAVIRHVVEKGLGRREAAERLGIGGAPDQAGGAPLSGERRGGPGVRASWQAAEQCHRRGSSPGGCGSGAEAVPGFRADVRAREAGRGPRPAVVRGDAAEVDDRGRPVAGEDAPGGSRASEPSPAGVSRGLGADRRLAARLVRGSRAGVRADRVRRRRDDAAAGGRGSSPRATAAYMETRAHLAAHGRPVAYYSDRHSVFRVNKKDSRRTS